jgi:PhnB protein
MQILPYLFFDGRTEEALEFYRNALGAEILFMLRMKDSPPEAQQQRPIPPEAANKVMHASFRIGATTVMASDGPCQGQPNFHGFSLSINLNDPAKAEQLFNGLAAGGTVKMPLGKTFFSPCFGMVTDRFGVAWMIHVEAPSPSGAVEAH